MPGIKCNIGWWSAIKTAVNHYDEKYMSDSKNSYISEVLRARYSDQILVHVISLRERRRRRGGLSKS